jgi:hypothetical protein
MSKKSFTFDVTLWVYPAEHAAWHFVTVPKKYAPHLKRAHGTKRRGWGSVRVSVTIGSSTWDTSVFPDKKLGSYVLPVKAAIRKKEKVSDGDRVKVRVVVRM